MIDHPPAAYHPTPLMIFPWFGKFWPVVGPEIRPDGTGWSRDSVFRLEHPERTRSGQFRPKFGSRPRTPFGQKLDFSLEADIRFMGLSWMRAHGLIFGKVYIVWVCAPRYSPLSSPRSRFRENSALNFGPNFVIHSGGIFYRWYFLIQNTQ